MALKTLNRAVQATMNYTVDNGRPAAYYFYEPDPGDELNPAGTDPRPVQIWDAWPARRALSVDREGFELQDFQSAFQDFADDGSIKSGFYPEVVDFVKQHTGAKRVEVFDHTIRRRQPPEQMVFSKPSTEFKQQTSVQRPAVLLVHSDYTVQSGPQRVRDIVPDDADELLGRRVAFFNVWKPLYRTVHELPLAMIDAQTHQRDDLIRMALKYRDRTGEIYVMRYSPAHRWMYFPQMEKHHALLLKTFDSELDGRCRFMGHSAFEDPDTPADAPKRESIEVRTMAFF
ncbi:MAG: methyltransferase [Betaproteobacteria bacterium]|jgi:hypothetical protein|nr:methyltransferase [Betaproteobacteria bacterium]